MTRTVLLITAFALFSFSVKRNKKFIPPGTVQLSETFFADETEISNLSWGEYEHWTAVKFGKGSKEHLATLPDTLVWREKTTYNEPYVTYYYRHKAYKDYPVVGISYEQAMAFCKWRTERVKEFYMIAYKRGLQIEYTLPSKQEWELISNNGGWIFSNNCKNEKQGYKLNCVHDYDSSATIFNNGHFDVTDPVYSYRKNNFGLFNTFGNVAEMTIEKGICKGGSWRHRIEECRAGNDISYSKPEAWLGFRCVCILKQTAR